MLPFSQVILLALGRNNDLFIYLDNLHRADIDVYVKFFEMKGMLYDYGVSFLFVV